MKKYIFFILSILISVASICQSTASHDRVIVREGLYLKGTWLDSIQKAGDFVSDRTVPTSKAVADYLKTFPQIWLSVTDFGVKADDTLTDYTTNIQAALSSGANFILFPPGKYSISSPLKINSNTTIYGYGAILIRNAALDNMMINNADGVTGLYTANTNIEIYGLRFDGNKNNFATPAATLLVFGHANTIKIKDCHLYNIPGYHGIELNAVDNCIVEGCTFYNSSGSEFLQLDYMGGTALFPWFGPFDNTPCRYIEVTNCYFYNGGAGIGSHSGGAQHTNIIFSDNIIRNILGHGISLENYGNLIVSNNKLDSCEFGIAAFGGNGLANQGRTVISGNHISNMFGFGRAITMIGPDDVVVIDNVINQCTDGGIDLRNCDRFVISNNILKNTNSGTVTDVGFAAISVNIATSGYITNNTILKDPAGLSPNTNTIRVAGASSNVTIENNSAITPAGALTTTLTSLAGTKIIVGVNTINGIVTPYISTKTANYTYAPTDGVLNVDATAGNITITINPSIFNKSGLIVRKISGDANSVTILPSTGTINGAASVILTTQNQTAIIKSDWVNLDATII